MGGMSVLLPVSLASMLPELSTLCSAPVSSEYRPHLRGNALLVECHGRLRSQAGQEVQCLFSFVHKTLRSGNLSHWGLLNAGRAENAKEIV